MPPDARIAIAYSGGLDSTVLLDAAVRVAGASRCVALHVHHGLSANADAWVAHAEASAAGVSRSNRCASTCRATAASVSRQRRASGAMRRSTRCASATARPRWLTGSDNKAETVLLQLLRGAGIAGLAAMAPRYRPDGVSVERVRPLLRLLRAQLERYATQRDLAWIDDESNNDTRYARNALRIDVLPALAVHFRAFAMRSAARPSMAAAQRLLDDLAELDFAVAARDDGQALSRDALVAFDDTRGANLLRFWMRRLGLPGASAARLANMMRQLRATHVAHALRVDHAGNACACIAMSSTGKRATAANRPMTAPGRIRKRCSRGTAGSLAPAGVARHVRVRAGRGGKRRRGAGGAAARARLAARARAGGERMRTSPAARAVR